MNHGSRITADIQKLLQLFIPHCKDSETMTSLLVMVQNENRWSGAHQLFQRIRSKTLQADRSENLALQVQYSFEEICAKTIFNLTESNAPFDSDSPYFVVPMAVALARSLGINDKEILDVVAA